jgi:hypothetical protein
MNWPHCITLSRYLKVKLELSLPLFKHDVLQSLDEDSYEYA